MPLMPTTTNQAKVPLAHASWIPMMRYGSTPLALLLALLLITCMQSEDGSEAISIAETKLELQKLRDEIGMHYTPPWIKYKVYLFFFLQI